MGSTRRNETLADLLPTRAVRRPSPYTCAAPITLVAFALLLATGACAIAAAAVSQAAHPWLMLLAILPLFRVIQVLRPWPATCAGGFFGACLCAFLLAGGVMHTSGTQAWLLLIGAPALYAGLGAALTRRIGFKPFVLAVGWMPIELALRPLALRYGLLPGGGLDGAVYGLVGRAFGYVLVAFLVAYASAMLLAILTRFRLRLDQPHARLWCPPCAGRRAWCIPQIWHAGHGPSPALPRGPPIQHACVALR